MYKKIINNTLYGVLRNSNKLAKALLIPFLILLIFDYLTMQNQGSMFITIISSIVSFLISVTIAITTHRVLLLENGVPTWGLYKFTAREFKFLFYSFLLVLIMLIPAVILSFIPYGGVILAAIYVLVVISRLSLVFPAISIDEDIEFKDSWEYTKGHKWLIIVTVVIFPALIALLIGLVYGFVIGYIVEVFSSKLVVLYSLLNIFITVFMISALSSTYKYLKEEKDAQLDEVDIVFDPIVKEEMINEDTFRLNISIDIEEDFEFIKNYLQNKYKELGFISIVIEKEDSFMLKNPEENNSYVSLSIVEDRYIIEVFNTAKPYCDFLEKYKD